MLSDIKVAILEKNSTNNKIKFYDKISPFISEDKWSLDNETAFRLALTRIFPRLTFDKQ